MRRMLLASVAAALLPAPALAGERQHICTGQASGAAGERVDASIYLTRQGTRVGASASWDPPHAGGTAQASKTAPDMALSILYPEPDASGIGEASGGTVMVMAFTPPGGSGPRNPQHQLDGLRLEARLDGGPPQPLRLTSNPLIADLPMTAMRVADLPVGPGTTSAALRLLDRKGRELAVVRYSLADRQSRNSLFTTAWQAAELAAQHPETCELTTESDD